MSFVDENQLLKRILLVCNQSGWRGEGIFKCLEENANLASALLECPDFVDEEPFFFGCAEFHHVFFINLLRAVQPTFPEVGQPQLWKSTNIRWPGYSLEPQLTSFEIKTPSSHRDCWERIHSVVMSRSQGVLSMQDMNRNFLKRFMTNTFLSGRFPWFDSWITVKDIFFTDLRRALKLGESLDAEQWVGVNYSMVLLDFKIPPEDNMRFDSE